MSSSQGVTSKNFGLGNIFKNPMFLPTEANRAAARKLAAARAANAAAIKAAANAKAAANRARANAEKARAQANAKARANAEKARAQANAKKKLNAALAARQKLEQNAARAAANAIAAASAGNLTKQIRAHPRYPKSNALQLMAAQLIINHNIEFLLKRPYPPNSAWKLKGLKNHSNIRQKLEKARKNYKDPTKKKSNTVAQFKANYDAWRTSGVEKIRRNRLEFYKHMRPST
jgi:hypothetical protein